MSESAVAPHTPSPVLIIRRGEVQDAEAMVDFLEALFEEALDTIGPREAPSVEAEREIIQRMGEDGRCFFLLAYSGAQLVGLLDVQTPARPESRHMGRLGISIARRWRGRGVGRRLITEAIAEAKSWPGYCRLELEVVAWNEPGIHLYESLGFQTEGRKVRSVNLRGRPEDLLIMGLTW
jgi:L-phenylalanine/L-methionine N-acetyltransferase